MHKYQQDYDPCTHETLYSSLRFLGQEARRLDLYFEAHLIGLAALAVQDSLEGRKSPKDHRPITVTATVHRGGS